METLKLNRATLAQIRQLATPRIGRKGRLELGQRAFYDGENKDKYYWNRYTEGDDEHGDLADTREWEESKEIYHELINGKLLLDYYLHNENEMVGNLMVEFDNKGITRAWNDVCEDRDLIYSR